VGEFGLPQAGKMDAAHRGRINAVMVVWGGVRLPCWYNQTSTQMDAGCGLEWLHRLVSEPRRLWRRYLVTNTIFITLAAKQLLNRKWKRVSN